MNPCKKCNKKDPENGGYNLKIWYDMNGSGKCKYRYMIICGDCWRESATAPTRRGAWEKWDMLNRERG